MGLISLSAFDADVDAGAALEGGADVAEEGFLGSALEEEEDAAGADEDGRALEIALQTIFIHELPISENIRDSNSVSQTKRQLFPKKKKKIQNSNPAYLEGTGTGDGAFAEEVEGADVGGGRSYLCPRTTSAVGLGARRSASARRVRVAPAEKEE